MALKTDFSGKVDFSTLVRAKVPGGEVKESGAAPAADVWAEISAKSKPSKIHKGECGIRTRDSAPCRTWRAIDETLRHFMRTGEYTPGSGIAAGRGSRNNGNNIAMVEAFRKASSRGK